MRHPRGLPDALAALRRPLVMGVLNVTPDSFSDGGAWLDPGAAVAHGTLLHRRGADVVDVGGESTRPGATRISAEEEARRVLPVVRGLVQAGVPVSIDTMRADVAAAAVDEGACIVNDVSGGLADPGMVPWLATRDVPFIVMHWRGHSVDMDRRAVYDDVVAEVCAELDARLAALDAAGVDRARVVLDPGLGFAKTADHNWALLTQLDRLHDLGRPILVGASRKRFLGELLADGDGAARPVDRRDFATDAVSALAAGSGVWGVRVHDVLGTLDAVHVGSAWHSASARARTAPADVIAVTGIRGFGYHGVLATEREQGQEFSVDVAMTVSTEEAAATDDLARTIDYSAVAAGIHAVITGEPYDLIETVADRCAAVALSFPGVRRVRVTVHKPEAPVGVPFEDVTVTIVRPT